MIDLVVFFLAPDVEPRLGPWERAAWKGLLRAVHAGLAWWAACQLA